MTKLHPAALARSSLNWWRTQVISTVDHDEVTRQISEEAGWSYRYAFLIVISAAISLLGLLMPSVAVLIGAMLLSPLMMPIIGLGFGIAKFDFSEMRRAATALGAGALLAVALSVVLVRISPVQTITTEIAGRTQPTLFDLLVALLSAVAGGYALVRGRGATVVGVAIAIALMPPLVVVGFGIATANWTIFSGSLLLFVTNAVTIALTAALVARGFGFGAHLSPQHTGWQVLLFLGATGLLCVPLGTALRKIAFQAVAQRQVRDTLLDDFPDGARLSQVEIDHNADPIRVRAVMLTPELKPNADKVLALDLHRRLDRPVDVHVDQLRISPDTGAAEAAEIAQASTSGAAPTTAQDRAVADLALIVGVDADAVRVSADAHELRAAAAPLPGLGMAGYRALEARAGASLPAWNVMVAPPPDAALPAIALREGVVDDASLAIASWGSARLGRPLAVKGGTRAQRQAIADGLKARGGTAVAGDGGGVLRLAWQEETPGRATRQSGRARRQFRAGRIGHDSSWQ